MISNGILSADHASNFAAGPLDEFTILLVKKFAWQSIPSMNGPVHQGFCLIIDHYEAELMPEI